MTQFSKMAYNVMDGIISECKYVLACLNVLVLLRDARTPPDLAHALFVGCEQRSDFSIISLIVF